ncbi:hypothetical protein PMAYCL1PPCAC_26390, partial [Pristionchus mayeri]
DAAALVPVDQRLQVAIGAALTIAYGGGAVMAFFTKHLPAWFHQLYVIMNCAAIATFYLTLLPGYTAWFLLAAVVLWDIFAVLAPCGPLRIALERSQDYGADILRFMMFTADADEPGASPSSSAGAHQQPEDEEKAAPGAAGDAAAAADEEDATTAAEATEEEKRAVMEQLLLEGVPFYEEEEEPEAEDEAVVVHRPEKRLSAGTDDQDQIREILAKMLSAAEKMDAAESGDE